MTIEYALARGTARRFLPFLTVGALALGLSGCATAVIGSVTVGQLSAMAGVASIGTTGKGLQDHALSAVTGQNCRLIEGIFRRDRRICEEQGSPATEHDFPGVVVFLMGPVADDAEDAPADEPEVIYAGLASDYRPTLTRGERRTATAEQEIALPVQLASLDLAPARDDRPMFRPDIEGMEANRIDEIAMMPLVLDADFPLTRTERQSGAVQASLAENELPHVLEWADAHPAPTIATVRLAVQ